MTDVPTRFGTDEELVAWFEGVDLDGLSLVRAKGVSIAPRVELQFSDSVPNKGPGSTGPTATLTFKLAS